MILPLLAVIAVSFVAFNDLLSALEDLGEEAVEEVAPIAGLEDLVEQAERLLHDGIWHPEKFDPRAFQELVPDIDQAYAATDTLPLTQTEERDGIRRSRELWSQVLNRWQKLNTSGLTEAERQRVGRDLAARLREAVISLERTRSISLAEVEGGRNQEKHWRNIMNLFLPLVLITGVGIAIFMASTLFKAIVRPVRALERGAQRLADGELSFRVGELSRDELGDLARTFNLMADRLQKSHQTLEGLSNLDFLTGLANVREFYRLFHDEIRRADRYQHPLSLIILDVDIFKEVNDTFGHQAGDLVLQEVGRKLRELVRKIDHVARIGGDEFAILFPETESYQALELAERIRRYFDHHQIEAFHPSNQPLRVTISIGLGTYPADADQANELFALTDQALYRAKNTGRNRLCLVEKRAGSEQSTEPE